MKIYKLINDWVVQWIELIVCAWPDSYMGEKMRRSYWSRQFRLTSQPSLARMAKIIGNKDDIFIGDRFICGEYVTINFSESAGIYIGNNVRVGPHAYVRTSNHKFDQLDTHFLEQGYTWSKMNHKGKDYSVIIEDNVLIGARAILLSGAKIGEGSVIIAGSVIATEIPPHSIVIGNPARVVGSRLQNNDLSN